MCSCMHVCMLIFCVSFRSFVRCLMENQGGALCPQKEDTETEPCGSFSLVQWPNKNLYCLPSGSSLGSLALPRTRVSKSLASRALLKSLKSCLEIQGGSNRRPGWPGKSKRPRRPHTRCSKIASLSWSSFWFFPGLPGTPSYSRKTNLAFKD